MGDCMLRTAEIGKEQIKADLAEIGLKKGSHVAVALSLKSVGRVVGGPDALIDAILEIIGSEGTLMMNTFTELFPLSEVERGYVFDPASSVPNTGIVPRTLWKRKGAIRSRHPVCSVVAIGNRALYLTGGHDGNAENPFLPYERLAEIGGLYLSIGLQDRFVAIFHEVQRRAGLIVVPMFSGVLYKNSKGKIRLYVFQNPPSILMQPKLVPFLVKNGFAKRGKVGMASSVIARADDLIKALVCLLREDPTLSLCGNFFCVHCREVERILDLYDGMREPKFFQKNLLVRRVIGFRNKLVLKRYGVFSFRKFGNRGFPSLSYLMEFGPVRFLSVVRRSNIRNT
jgi:aminoglycoside 3-N-acetyltransferase